MEDIVVAVIQVRTWSEQRRERSFDGGDNPSKQLQTKWQPKLSMVERDSADWHEIDVSRCTSFFAQERITALNTSRFACHLRNDFLATHGA